MSEARLQKAIQRAINREGGCRCLVYHGGPYTARGHSDLYGSRRGTAFYLEVKLPGREDTVTHHQEQFLTKMRKAGAIVGVVTSIDEAWGLLDL